MTDHIIGAVLGAVTVGLCVNIAPSGSNHLNGKDPSKIKQMNINCTCGKRTIKVHYESIYGCKYDQNIQCNKCRAWLGGHKYVHHCSTHDVIKYPNGYTFCNSCIQNIQKSSLLQQENDKLFCEIEQKVDSKQFVNEKEKFMASFKNGWMMKRGGYHTAWKHRYFELNGVLKTLTYYIESNKLHGAKYKLKGFIDFKKYPICKMMKSKQEQEFHVVTSKREWVFKCQNRKERDEWYNVIKILCAKRGSSSK
eukprot:UN09038